ncbi:hypothetical protein HN784_01900 [bacterium]|jgi:hypothetical protein|nr:hypothetical protein [bacterium]MBT4251064.1 hypothetical protein [bacterium]MBT4597969.1 hypothetical protein [bacterium]MBT6753462.1 hypothetical protein [bacterium]MBT7038011.1 hypothetical protein [bacterium]
MKNKRNKTIFKKIVKIAEAFLSWLKRNHNKFLLIFAFVVIANVVFLITFRGYIAVSTFTTASKGYLESKIRNENVDHFVATRKVIKSVDASLKNIEEESAWPKKNVWLQGEERINLISQLQRLDEISYDLQWVADEYFSDYSIQYYPYSTGTLASYIYETRHLKKSIDRFVRVAEIAILLDSFDKRQIEVIEEELNEVKAYLENLIEIEKDLDLLNHSGCDKKGIHI